jgi:Metallo-beta-lactamase superfamily
VGNRHKEPFESEISAYRARAQTRECSRRRRQPQKAGTPAHEHAGHVSLFLPRERILIAGDALNNREGLQGSASEHTADAAQAEEALRTLVALHPDTVVFGHGPSIVGGAAERLAELDRGSSGT